MPIALGVASRVRGVVYAQQRHTFGAHRQTPGHPVRWRTWPLLEAARLLTASIAAKLGAASGPMSKRGWQSCCARAAFEIATRPSTVYGYTTELPIERYYRDAPLMIIGEGTGEIQRWDAVYSALPALRQACSAQEDEHHRRQSPAKMLATASLVS
jgi:alkylation response protein AidB-like acyl-CoA dehydrogenase